LWYCFGSEAFLEYEMQWESFSLRWVGSCYILYMLVFVADCLDRTLL
jgi:hypothetical protein